MRPESSGATPSCVAAWLVSLFALQNDAEPILGDLAEEFSAIESGSGTCAARRWYWRQSLRSAARLFWMAFRSAPWLIACTTLAGLLILWYSRNLPTRLVCAVIDRDSSFYMNHFSIWQFTLNYGIPAVGMIVAVLVGCLIAIVASGREIVATATFGMFELVGAPILMWALFVATQAFFGHHLMFSEPSSAAYIPLTISVIYHFGGVGGLVLYFTQPFTAVLLPVFGGTVIRNARMRPQRRKLPA